MEFSLPSTSSNLIVETNQSLGSSSNVIYTREMCCQSPCHENGVRHAEVESGGPTFVIKRWAKICRGRMYLGLPFTSVKTCKKIWGLPWILEVTGNTKRTCCNFGSRNYFKSVQTSLNLQGSPQIFEQVFTEVNGSPRYMRPVYMLAHLCMTEVGPPLCGLCMTNPIIMDRTLQGCGSQRRHFPIRICYIFLISKCQD